MRTNVPVAQASDTLFDLQRQMQSSGSPVVSVLEGRRFLGLVTLEDVRNAFRALSARQWRFGRVQPGPELTGGVQGPRRL
jgi:CBS domain-containing protein